MGNSRSSLMWVVSFTVVATIVAIRPIIASAQDFGPVAEVESQAVASSPEPVTHELAALARPEARIAFGVRRGALQHVVATSPFDDAYSMAVDAPDSITLVATYRFGRRAVGGVRIMSSAASVVGLGPSEEPFHIGSHAPIVWNLAERVRIAFGGSARSTAIVNGIDRPNAPMGSLTIEFGDRK